MLFGMTFGKVPESDLKKLAKDCFSQIKALGEAIKYNSYTICGEKACTQQESNK
jgi:hypothetical protein